MSWGTRVIGLNAAREALEQIAIEWDDDSVYVVGPTVEYAIYQEYGTSRHAAQPFIRPAAREVQRELPTIAQDYNSTEAIVKAVALEVERRAKQRAPVDTGALRSSIKAEKVR